MFWVRGEKSDFDGWRDRGCSGWGWADLLPYFRKIENFTDGPAPLRGDSGPVHVRRQHLRLEVVDDFVTAAQQAGHPFNPDFNGEQQQGVALAQVSQRRGLRASTSTAYLRPVRKRRNLTVLTSAFVTKVRIVDGRAVGVEYTRDGAAHVAAAAREVIVSAGALTSPKLLMLSGVGPADHLREHGVEVVVDRPAVGANLQEHSYGMLVYRTEANTLYEELRPLKMLRHGLNFILRRKGALTVAGGAAVIFSQLVGERPTEAETILMPIGLSFGDGEGEHGIHDVKISPHGFMVYPSFVHPSGRGSVRLASADPSQPAAITHHLLGDGDVATLIQACREARRIMGQPAMAAKKVVETMPGVEVQTDEQWAGYLARVAFRPYHPSGTCRMGADDDAVVDPQLRVRGVQGLRVVDTSIFPDLTSGNTNAPTIVVAEKAADMILSAR